MASTANRPDLASNEVAFVNYPVKGSTHIYAGAHVMLVSGYLLPAADTSGGVYVGQASTEANNTGADGAITCQVIPPIVDPFKTLKATSPAIATWLGVHVFFSADDTVVLAGSSTNKVCAGRVISLVNTTSSGSVMVDTTDKYTVASAA